MNDDEAVAFLGPEPKTAPAAVGMHPDDAASFLDEAPPASVSSMGSRLQGGSQEFDNYLGATPLGKILDAFGHGAEQAWGTQEIVQPDTADLLKKAGVFPDVEKGQAGIIRGFNEGVLRPAASGLDMAIRAGGQALRGIGAGFGGVESAAVELARQVAGGDVPGGENQAEQFSRGVGGVIESYLADTGSHMPMHPLDLETARTEGVLGTEAQWKGVAPTEDFPAGSVTHYTAPAEATPGTEGIKPYAASLSPDVASMAEPTPVAPTNVHEAARAIAPDTFNEFDSLSEGRGSLRTQIATQQDALRRQAESQAPGAAEIADLQNRLQDTTPRLAKKYQARLDELMPARDAFLADDFTLSALTRDTPEITQMRQQLQQIDYRMRDLAPDVTAAYREASVQFPEAVAAAPEPAPEPSPTPPASEAQERLVTAPEVAGEAPAPVAETPAAAPEPTILGGNPAAAEPPRVNIAADVSSKLQAAGRPADEAAAAGQVQEALWRTRAAAFEGRKGTAEEMYAREAPDIRAGRDVGTPQRALELAQNGGKELEQRGESPIVRFRRDAADIEAKLPPVADGETRLWRGNRPGEVDTARQFTNDLPGIALPFRETYGGDVSYVDVPTADLAKYENKAGAATFAEFTIPDDVAQGVKRVGLVDDTGVPNPHDSAPPQGNGWSYAQAAQGKIRLTNDGRSVITLFKSANASTFLHETGHDWLERMVRDAADPDAPARMATDADAVRKYLGNDGGDLTTKQHEKFARSFERYFMEGRAPSSALARVFEQFKGWLTTIYQTVARLKAPITDDIRDVFDRLLSSNPERPTIAPESAADTRELTGHAEPLTPYADVPREPKRLINFLRESVTHGEGENATTLPGGLRDPNGDVAAIVGGPKGRPGLINKNGQHLDDATLKAWEAGYFPEHDQRPDINHLLDAIREDHNGNPRYSMHDQDAVDAYNHALTQNAEVDRLASQHGIDPTGMTRDQFFDAITEKASTEEVAEEIHNRDAAHESIFDELDAEMRDFAEPPLYGISEPRTLEDLENAYGQENAARSAGQGASRDAGSGHADGSAGAGEAGGGPVGRVAGVEGGTGAEAGVDVSSGSGDSGGSGPSGSEPVSADGGPEREPKLPPIDVKTEPQDFRTKEDREIEKAANIRLDKLNTPDDMSQALRDLAQQNGDFMDARYGTPAYQTQMDIRNTRILLRGATSDMMAAALKAAGGDPAAIADWVTKQQRAAMVFNHLSTLSADWAHAGHELNKVMEGWGDAKSLAQNIQDTTGKTLFQLQKQAALMAAMPTAEQAGKLASDFAKNWADKGKDIALSLFINNLISGPITHMAYMTGNTMMSLYRAVPETAMQASIGAIRQAVSAEPITDRVYFREIAPQLYGMFKGARDGIAPAMRALQTGVPELAGGAQGELAFANARQQVIPGIAGRILETPSRAVAALHTFSYSMSYSQEIGRLAARDAAARGLTGDAFNAEVARLTSSPTPQMMEAAGDAGMHGTLMSRPAEGSLQQWLVEGTNKFFAFKLALPFMQIGSNILKEGIIDRTGLSMLSSEARAEAMGLRGGAARDIRIGRIAAGSSLAAATVGMAMEGMVTGGGPADPNKRRVLEAAGWSPYSLKIGDTYIPYRKFLGPMGPLVASSADMFEIGHSLGQDGLTQAATALAFGFSEVVASETWMSGISNLVQAVHDPGSKGEQYLRSMATSFIPFSVGMSQVARLVDPYQRRAQTILDAARNKIPFASETLEPQIGVWGQPIGSHTMVSPTAAVEDPVDARLRALGIGVTALEKKIVGIPLTDQQFTQYSRTAGILAHQRLSAMVSAPGFAQLPAGIQTKAIGETITKSRETARAMIKMQAPAIVQQATQNKLDLRTNGKGGAY